MANEEKNNWEDKLKDRVNAYERKKDFELAHGLRNTKDQIGGYIKYDHKATGLIASILTSLAVITKDGLFLYVYAVGVIKAVRDTVASGFTGQNFNYKTININHLFTIF